MRVSKSTILLFLKNLERDKEAFGSRMNQPSRQLPGGCAQVSTPPSAEKSTTGRSCWPCQAQLFACQKLFVQFSSSTLRHRLARKSRRCCAPSAWIHPPKTGLSGETKRSWLDLRCLISALRPGVEDSKRNDTTNGRNDESTYSCSAQIVKSRDTLIKTVNPDVLDYSERLITKRHSE